MGKPMNKAADAVLAAEAILRKGALSDAPIIFSTWSKALWFETKRDPLEQKTFMRAAHKMIRNTLNKPGTIVRVACLADDLDHVLGYSVVSEFDTGEMEALVLDWVYVKLNYRNNGVGRLLTNGSYDFVAPPSTRVGEAIVEDKLLEVISYEQKEA